MLVGEPHPAGRDPQHSLCCSPGHICHHWGGFGQPSWESVFFQTWPLKDGSRRAPPPHLTSSPSSVGNGRVAAAQSWKGPKAPVAQAPHFSAGQVGAQSAEGAADVKGVSYHSLQALQRRRNLQMGHLLVLLRLFLQQECLSSRGREREYDAEGTVTPAAAFPSALGLWR